MRFKHYLRSGSFKERILTKIGYGIEKQLDSLAIQLLSFGFVYTGVKCGINPYLPC